MRASALAILFIVVSGPALAQQGYHVTRMPPNMDELDPNWRYRTNPNYIVKPTNGQPMCKPASLNGQTVQLCRQDNGSWVMVPASVRYAPHFIEDADPKGGFGSGGLTWCPTAADCRKRLGENMMGIEMGPPSYSKDVIGRDGKVQ